MSIELASWNVNGIRACHKGGFAKWFKNQAADVVCLQEIKARREQVPEELLNPLMYHSSWNPAEKPGYSGVAIYSKKEPIDVRAGMGTPEYDCEGRVLLAEFKTFSVVSVYFPNSQREHQRLNYKLGFCRTFAEYCERERARGKMLVVCGDWNIAPTEIDLKNPKANVKNAGFLPEERAWMSEFQSKGYVDCFREFNTEPGHYTWWSYRPGVRERNIGWRLDYFMTHAQDRRRLRASSHLTQVKGSDHCPVTLTLKS